MGDDEQPQDEQGGGEAGGAPTGPSDQPGQSPQGTQPGQPGQPVPPAPSEPLPPAVRHFEYVPYLRAWRVRKGYTRAQLAERTVTPQKPKPLSLFTFRAIESYGRPATFDTVQRLADALELSVDDLLHTDPTRLPPRMP